jgi:hypothetical protein
MTLYVETQSSIQTELAKGERRRIVVEARP